MNFRFAGLMCRLRLIGGLLLLSALVLNVRLATPQERITDDVAVTILRDQIFAATPGEGLPRVELSPGEQVVAVEARGINALVQTSMRLLGFSAKAQRWAEQRTEIFIDVLERRITPQLILVRTNKRLYGFQGPVGTWKVEELGNGEVQRDVLVGDHIAVVVTDRRALAFSAFTGGFFSQRLFLNEPLNNTTVKDNVVILSTPRRRLIFRSRLTAWVELRLGERKSSR